ncbi:MAG: Mov34/MPN/PAD-1 [Bacteroidetes bacterium]|nr:Mov34/MPN/PAD-1 [Bacteroidota bacterium]
MRTYPEECCGVIFGEETEGGRCVHDVLAIHNTVDRQRNRRFLVSPEEYRSVEQRARNERTQILGWYHSHPDHPAQPSSFDLNHALPWFSYVIVSVDKGISASVRSWLMRDDRSTFDEEVLAVDTEPARYSSEIRKE